MSDSGNGTVSTFSNRVVTILVVVVASSFLLAFVLAAFGDELSETVSHRADSFSVSAIGHAAWFELMDELGVQVERRRRRNQPVPPPAVLLALEPRSVDASLSRKLTELADHSLFTGSALVLAAPKWSGLPGGKKPGWVILAELLPLEGFNDGLQQFLAETLAAQTPSVVRAAGAAGPIDCVAGDGTTLTLDLEPVQHLELPDDWEPWLVCDDLVLVARYDLIGLEPLWLIADPEPFSTVSLARQDNARLGHLLLTEWQPAQGVLVDETIHGHGDRDSLLGEWLRFPMALAVLQGLVVVGLVAWHGSRRFGGAVVAETTPVDGRRVLVDNAARLLALGRHSRRALLAYYDQTLLDVSHHCGIRRDALQTLTDARGLGVDLTALRDEIDALPPTGHTPADTIVRLARRLHRWRTEMTDGHRGHR